jgi:uncharacterized protein (TIGR02145 family)
MKLKLMLLATCIVMMGNASIHTQTVQTVKDVDGNSYHTVVIGTQVWMVENLKTTRYRNGDAIPNVADPTKWAGLTTGAYCNYDNDVNNGKKYGHMYNWYAVSDSRNIAPSGWHVATDAEWATLISYLGGVPTVVGVKLREAGNAHWISSIPVADNKSGFTALPGGYRSDGGEFGRIGRLSQWWTSTEDGDSYVRKWDIAESGSNQVDNYFASKAHGFYIRCVRD